jgi:crossover junction endodeoxyribonuclease RuvC
MRDETHKNKYDYPQAQNSIRHQKETKKTERVIMQFLGIDPSLNNTGWVIIKDGAVSDNGCIKPKKIFGVERLAYIKSEFEIILESHQMEDNDIAIIENYSFGAHGQAVFQMGELGGILRVSLYENETKFHTVAPATLKKFATGSGKSEKDNVLKCVYQKWNHDFTDNNIADAFVLAKIGQSIHEWQNGKTDFLKYEKECIQVILHEITKPNSV